MEINSGFSQISIFIVTFNLLYLGIGELRLKRFFFFLAASLNHAIGAFDGSSIRL